MNLCVINGDILDIHTMLDLVSGLIEEKLQSAYQEVTESAPVVDIPDSQAHLEGSYDAHDGINGEVKRDI